MMKALVKEQEVSSYHYKDVAVPIPGREDLLVKVSKVALCGSDINVYHWNDGNAVYINAAVNLATCLVARVLAQVPLTPGHEMVGEVSYDCSIRVFQPLSATIDSSSWSQCAA